MQKGGQQTPVTLQPQLKDGPPPTFKREHGIIWINQTDKLGSLIRGGPGEVGGTGSRHSRFLQEREAANMENSMRDTQSSFHLEIKTNLALCVTARFLFSEAPYLLSAVTLHLWEGLIFCLRTF